MELQLKSIKIHQDLSEETLAFSATIYVDGQRVGGVRSDGRGGCYTYHWHNRAQGQALEAWAALQPTQYDFEKLDQLVDHLLEEHQEKTHLRRHTRTKTVFRLKSDQPGEWRVLHCPFSPTVKQSLQKRYGSQLEAIANEDERLSA